MNQEAQFQLKSIIDGFRPDNRRAIAAMPEQNLIRLHHGLGTWVRNLIRSNEIGALSLWSRSQVPGGVKHFDDLSGPIIHAIREALRSSESDVTSSP
jgi:hypothetical protein